MSPIHIRKPKEPKTLLGKKEVKQCLEWNIGSDTISKFEDDISNKIEDILKKSFKDLKDNFFKTLSSDAADKLLEESAEMIIDNYKNAYLVMRDREIYVNISPDYIAPSEGDAEWVFSITELCKDTHWNLNPIIRAFEDGLAILKERKKYGENSDWDE